MQGLFASQKALDSDICEPEQKWKLVTIRDYKGGESTFCSCCFLTTFVSRLLGLLLRHYLGAIVLVEGSQELGHEDHYNAPVQVLPHHGHISHLLYHLKVHLHLGGGNTRTGPGRPSQCTFETLDYNAIDEPEKMEMKAKKLTKIKLMSLPAAASPFFQLLKLLLAVLRRYSFSLLHFSIVAADL